MCLILSANRATVGLFGRVEQLASFIVSLPLAKGRREGFTEIGLGQIMEEGVRSPRSCFKRLWIEVCMLIVQSDKR